MLQALKEKTVEWLRWSERYTKTDMVYLAKGGGWLTGSKVFSILGGLALATAFANLVPKETYGTYKFLVSATTIIGAFTLSGMGTAVMQAAAKGFNGALKHGAKKKLKWSIGIVLVALGVAGYYYLQNNLTLASGMLMIAVLYPFRVSSGIYENFLKGKKDFKKASIYKVALEVFQITSMILTLFLTDSVLWIFFVFIASNTLAAVFFYFRTTSSYPQADTDTKKSMITFSKHLSVIKVFQRIAGQIDKILVWHFLGATQLAIYAFAILPVQKLKPVINSVGSLALPKFANQKITKLKETLPKKALLFAGATIILGVAIFYLLPFAFELIFPQYTSSVPFAQIYLISLIFLPSILFKEALTAHEKEKELYISSIGKDVVKIIALLIFLPIYGLWGAISVLIIEEFIKLTFNGYLFLRQEK